MKLWWLGAQPRTDAERFLCRVIDAARSLGVEVCVYGGYALEAHVGRRLCEHEDVDLFGRLAQWPRIQAKVADEGLCFDYDAPSALHVRRDGVTIADVLLVEQHPEGFPFVRAPLGANPLPPGSLDDGPVVRMWGRQVRVATLECLFVLKASGNFTGPRRPPDPKHARDLELIRGLLPPGAIAGLVGYCSIIPAPPEDRATLRSR